MPQKPEQKPESPHALGQGWLNFLGSALDGEEATLLPDVVTPANADAATVALDILLSDDLREAAWTRTACLGQWEQQATGVRDEALLRSCIQRLALEYAPDASVIGTPPPPGPSVSAEPIGPGSPARVPPWFWPTLWWCLGVCGAAVAFILMQIVHTHRAERRSNSVYP